MYFMECENSGKSSFLYSYFGRGLFTGGLFSLESKENRLDIRCLADISSSYFGRCLAVFT